MRLFRLVLLTGGVLAAALCGTALAKSNVTVTVNPNPVAPGAAYTIAACGLNTATARVLVYDGQQGIDTTVAVVGGCISDSALATGDGTTATAPLASGTGASVFVEWVTGNTGGCTGCIPQSTHVAEAALTIQ